MEPESPHIFLRTTNDLDSPGRDHWFYDNGSYGVTPQGRLLRVAWDGFLV